MANDFYDNRGFYDDDEIYNPPRITSLDGEYRMLMDTKVRFISGLSDEDRAKLLELVTNLIKDEETRSFDEIESKILEVMDAENLEATDKNICTRRKTKIERYRAEHDNKYELVKAEFSKIKPQYDKLNKQINELLEPYIVNMWTETNKNNITVFKMNSLKTTKTEVLDFDYSGDSHLGYRALFAIINCDDVQRHYEEWSVANEYDLLFGDWTKKAMQNIFSLEIVDQLYEMLKERKQIFDYMNYLCSLLLKLCEVFGHHWVEIEIDGKRKCSYCQEVKDSWEFEYSEIYRENLSNDEFVGNLPTFDESSLYADKNPSPYVLKLRKKLQHNEK